MLKYEYREVMANTEGKETITAATAFAEYGWRLAAAVATTNPKLARLIFERPVGYTYTGGAEVHLLPKK